jgi:cellobiose phosphorylase
MYRLILESLPGLRREARELYFQPCLPGPWPTVTVRYRFRDTPHRIVFRQHPVAVEPLWQSTFPESAA